MSDALCGPSNPLQTFQKHSQVDRTLQQDRLTGPRHSPAQGFRTPDPRTGSLDAEFSAFEAGPANPFQFEQSLPGYGAFPAFTQHAGAASWANDFKNLHLSNQPLPSQQFRTEAPLVRSSGGGWHNEFTKQWQGGSSSIAYEKQAIRQSQTTGFDWATQRQYMPMFRPQQDIYPEQMLHEPQHDVDMSQMDFENAFANAFQDAEEMSVEDAQGMNKEIYSNMLHQDGAYTNDHSSDTINHSRPEETVKIGSDAIQYTEQKDRTADQDTRDADELARTASQLLSSVQHDTSTKFQESQFLALMRKIRDREVEVREEDFKSTTPEISIQQQAEPQLGLTERPQAQNGQLADSTLRPHDPNSFQFPDLNQVYDPSGALQTNDYGFDQNQHGSRAAFQPQSHVQALHPGGRWYPEQSAPSPSRTSAPHMSGAISAEDFDRLDESANLATRYRRPSVIDATP